MHNPIGILTLGAGIDGMNPTIRFLPPLTVGQEDMNILRDALMNCL